eukprot:CAMPEP_0168209088 /NCGR_PEP_ID=MMETSP0140_2-20121125/2416_1 /TAXON_ID=44445 /ORGANISM="Pseudo-nitzschia australis, Strain 10249 10 AB" /LENGTH=58 /DNA_ID=CAMNT_0008135531 /DNA_START=155 /DNA_END=331 /DNA_ORIENTATION=+
MATLRLSSSTSPTTNTIDGYLQQLTDDTSISLAQKNDCVRNATQRNATQRNATQRNVV